MLLRTLDYEEQFRCLAGRCPDTCCKDWEIILDEDAISRYQKMPGVLGEQVRAAMLNTPGHSTPTDRPHRQQHARLTAGTGTSVMPR